MPNLISNSSAREPRSLVAKVVPFLAQEEIRRGKNLNPAFTTTYSFTAAVKIMEGPVTQGAGASGHRKRTA